jgi:hypothetical protein
MNRRQGMWYNEYVMTSGIYDLQRKEKSVCLLEKYQGAALIV